MNPWKDEKLLADVVARYRGGESPLEIARHFKLTLNQVGSKLDRLGLRRAPREPKAERPRQTARQSGAYGNMATRFSKLDAFRRCLRTGPKTSGDLAEMTDMSPHDVTSHLRRLIGNGEVAKRKAAGRHSTYALIKPAAPVMHGAALRSLEDAYVVARKEGVGSRDLAQRMNLTQTSAERFEDSYRAQTHAGSSIDNSCPKFARDDQHLKLLASLGRYPVLPTLAEMRGRT
jgi:hypothetical protein